MPEEVTAVPGNTDDGTGQPPFEVTVDGATVTVPDNGDNLLGLLRDHLGIHSAKDGCSPQGQCGCCTVLVDGQARVACVTPARRVRGRTITTLDGLDTETRQSWADAFTACGASQCGFCTPGIILRLEALHTKGASGPEDRDAVEQALLAHLCRCTGWRPILDAWDTHTTLPLPGTPTATAPLTSTAPAGPAASRDDAQRRAGLEGHMPQTVSPEIALGHSGFADDTAPADALVAVPDGSGGWALGESVTEARQAAGKVQGRRTTLDTTPPLALPPGDWDVTLQTSWFEPAYLETDASWCAPGGEPRSPLGNGGAFGGKVNSPVAAAARALADQHDRPVRVLFSREDAVRHGPKRPPLAAGLTADGAGIVRVARTPGFAAAVATLAPGLHVEQVDLPGPATSHAFRGFGWAEAAILLTAAARSAGRAGDAGSTRNAADAEDPEGWVHVTSPAGGTAAAQVTLGAHPQVDVKVACGGVLDARTLRSYCTGAAHMALGWVTSEGLAVDDDGAVHDLTIRSFGILRAVDTPPIHVELDHSDRREPVNGSDAVFAAVAAATWLAQGTPPRWPTGIPLRS